MTAAADPIRGQTPTGNATCHRGKWYARISLGGGKRPAIPMPWCAIENDVGANVRARVLADYSSRLRKAGTRDADVEKIIREGAALNEGHPDLDELRGIVDEVCERAERSPVIRPSITFKAFAEKWTSGELHEQHPDHVRKKDSADDDAARLERYVYPVVGNVAIASFTAEHAEDVMRQIDEIARKQAAQRRAKSRSAAEARGRAYVPPARTDVALRPRTRRHVAQVIHRVLSLAVYPAKLIASNPLPRGFLPSVGTRKAFSYVRPIEDAALLRCTTIPLVYRVLYGVLAREGSASPRNFAITLKQQSRLRRSIGAPSSSNRRRTVDAFAHTISARRS